MYALHAKTFMWTRTGLPVMVVMLGSTLDVPAWKPCQEARISGYVKTLNLCLIALIATNKLINQ